MTVTVVPPMFKTSDGREFELESEAISWQEVADAQEAYARARRRFMNLLAENMVTADGCAFERMRTYWRVHEVHRGMAWIEEVSAYEHGIDLHEWNGETTERVQIRLPRQDRNGAAEGLWVAVDIGELYWSRRAATKALAESQKQTVADWQKRTETMESMQ